MCFCGIIYWKKSKEDSKGVIKSRKSKKDRQYNGNKWTEGQKMFYKALWLTQKTKDWVTTRVKSGAPKY
jgi:hypothetical protein